MRKSLHFLFYCLIVLSYSTALYAEDDYHDHGALHGGYFGDAGNLYHYEVMVEDRKILKLYLYDDEAQPMKVTGISARWTLSPDSSHSETGIFLEATTGTHYWAELSDLSGEQVHVLIEVEKSGKWIPMEFAIPLTDKK